MRAVPAELEDAAAMDGCGKFGFFFRILVPLSQPALMTVTILSVDLRAGTTSSCRCSCSPTRRTGRFRSASPSYSTEHSTDTAAHPRVHDALDGAGAAVLPRRRAADRRRPLRRGQGLTRRAWSSQTRSCRECTPTRASAALAGITTSPAAASSTSPVCRSMRAAISSRGARSDTLSPAVASST